jgi:glutamine synthetase
MKVGAEISEIFGENVFSIRTMRDYLSENAFKSLTATICSGESIDPSIADEVADAMKTWAMEKGATHFTHWFQPLTGATAEKHDSFAMPDREGGVIMSFSGKELIKGEPDASSFPSGGLRATFEARGYTGWDPTSPAFIKESPNGSTLCIPSVFCGYHGEALDKKTPLLRSMGALDKSSRRLASLFGIKCNSHRAYANLGPEQEYFLIDRSFYEDRLDLLQTGRTLFGRAPAKHQQLDDHYFGSIKTRVMEFMYDLDRELWRLGVPAKTRHNEVCPAQFEIAPVFEELNLSVDHNMITMDVLRDVAEEHGFVCLLHEKPFAGVNGSGKHNNWSINGPDGKNWLTPGDNPQDNALFLTTLCALIKAVDTHAGLLRSSVASAGNDHRLGANEAPPAIISIFLGDELCSIIENIGNAKSGSSDSKKTIEIGVSSLPDLPRDTADRNRTSPFAFTGNKFEFRAPGSSQSAAGCNIVINSIAAEAFEDICDELEAAMADGNDFNKSLQCVLRDIVAKHKRILFNGDNYTEEWRQEAEERGLPNLVNTPIALKEMVAESSINLFEKLGVLSKVELESRYEVYLEAYEKAIQIEAICAANMARTMIAPSAIAYEGDLANTIKSMQDVDVGDSTESKKLLAAISGETEKLLRDVTALENCATEGFSPEALPLMLSLREAADNLEGLLPADYWMLPSYAEMLFML